MRAYGPAAVAGMIRSLLLCTQNLPAVRLRPPSLALNGTEPAFFTCQPALSRSAWARSVAARLRCVLELLQTPLIGRWPWMAGSGRGRGFALAPVWWRTMSRAGGIQRCCHRLNWPRAWQRLRIDRFPAADREGFVRFIGPAVNAASDAALVRLRSAARRAAHLLGVRRGLVLATGRAWPERGSGYWTQADTAETTGRLVQSGTAIAVTNDGSNNDGYAHLSDPF